MPHRAEIKPTLESQVMSLRERSMSVASGHRTDSRARSVHIPAVSVGAQAVGTLALAAIAVGALAIGALAIGRLAIGRARIRRLDIDELVVRHLRVTEQLQTPLNRDPES
jgi:hypothetical protein